MRNFENYGVLYKANTTCYASFTDSNLIEEAIDYYGVLREVIELQFWVIYMWFYLNVAGTTCSNPSTG